MDQKKIVPRSILLLEVIYVFTFVSLLLLQFISTHIGYRIFLESPIYWMILIGLIFILIKHRIKSSFVFKLALFFFASGSILNLLNIGFVAEIFFRLSLIGLLVGWVWSFIEYIKTNDNH